jgi:hypothetical protein
MREDLLIRKLQEALKEEEKVPAEVMHRELVEAGIIDEKGRVLKRVPEPPKMERPRKQKSRKQPKADS